MNVTTLKRAALGVAGAAAMAVSLLAVPAQADPAPGEYRQVVGVGSDTTQDVMQGLGEVILDPDGVPDNQLIASYHATGTSPIQTRPNNWPSNCTNLARPNGSSAGITALNADITAGTDCIDFARSSRGPNNTSTTDLTWIPYATDAVTWAVRSDSPLADNDAYTLANLRSIYNCDAAWRTIEGVTVRPMIPQAGSGTRAFWIQAMGLDANNLPSCVVDTNSNGQSAQEHNGEALVAAGEIMPYSIAQYIAQTNSAQTGVDDRRGSAVLQPINSVQPTTGTPAALNPSFPINRPVYNVVETARLDDPGIDLAFTTDEADPGIPGDDAVARVCANSSTITLFGFATRSDCGNFTATRGES